MTFLVVLNDPLHGAQRSHNGLRLAGALSRREGIEVRVFHFGNAVGCALSKRRSCRFLPPRPDGRRHRPPRWAVGCCRTCMDARGLADKLPVEGTRVGSTDAGALLCRRGRRRKDSATRDVLALRTGGHRWKPPRPARHRRGGLHHEPADPPRRGHGSPHDGARRAQTTEIVVTSGLSAASALRRS